MRKLKVVTIVGTRPEIIRLSRVMAKLDDQVKAAGLTFLNEIGLDPGIDHLATMKTIDEVAEKGGKSLN